MLSCRQLFYGWTISAGIVKKKSSFFRGRFTWSQLEEMTASRRRIGCIPGSPATTQAQTEHQSKIIKKDHYYQNETYAFA